MFLELLVFIHMRQKIMTNIDMDYILKVKKEYKKIIGIGETGLDFFYNHSDEDIQKKSFLEHIHAASQLNIPVIVHSRNAEHYTYEILKDEKKNSDLKILITLFYWIQGFCKKATRFGLLYIGKWHYYFREIY